MTEATETREVPGLVVPEVSDTRRFWAQDKRLVEISVYHDEHADDPTKECGAQGTMHSFSSNHHNFLEPWDPEEYGSMKEWLDDRFPLGWVLLSYFEHGACSWFPLNSETPAGVEFRWDGVRLAGVWEIDQDVLDNYEARKGTEYETTLEKYCEGVCEEYTAWCNGHVYGFSVSVLDPGDSKPASEGGYGIYDAGSIKDCVVDTLYDLDVTSLVLIN